MATPGLTLNDRVIELVKTLQFAWFIGHVLTMLGSLTHFVSTILFRSGKYSYKIAYFGAILSYGVVIYKTHGQPQLNKEYARKIVSEENFQYLILASFWLFSNPITVTLIPFLIFSSFHTLDYIRTTIIPIVFPHSTNTDNTNVWQIKTQTRIKSLYDQYYTTGMRFVAQSEVTIIPIRLLFGILSLQFVPFILFAQFLRFRYHLSIYTRQAFSEVCSKLDTLILSPQADPRIPPVIPKAYLKIKDLIKQFGKSIVQEPTVTTADKQK